MDRETDDSPLPQEVPGALVIETSSTQQQSLKSSHKNVITALETSSTVEKCSATQKRSPELRERNVITALKTSSTDEESSETQNRSPALRERNVITALKTSSIDAESSTTQKQSSELRERNVITALKTSSTDEESSTTQKQSPELTEQNVITALKTSSTDEESSATQEQSSELREQNVITALKTSSTDEESSANQEQNPELSDRNVITAQDTSSTHREYSTGKQSAKLSDRNVITVLGTSLTNDKISSDQKQSPKLSNRNVITALETSSTNDKISSLTAEEQNPKLKNQNVITPLEISMINEQKFGSENCIPLLKLDANRIQGLTTMDNEEEDSPLLQPIIDLPEKIGSTQKQSPELRLPNMIARLDNCPRNEEKSDMNSEAVLLEQQQSSSIIKNKDDDSLLSHQVPGPSVRKTIVAQKQSPKLRRRNAPASLETDLGDEEKFGKDNGAVPRKLDTAEAWSDGVIPRIPKISDLESPGKEKRVVDSKGDNNSPTDDSDNTEKLTSREQMKIRVIQGSVVKSGLTLGELRLLALSSEGFVNDDIRRVLWPRLLGLPDEEPSPVEGLETIHTQVPNEVYQQILKDVARSGSHFPPDSTEEEIERLHNEMTQLMCWVLHRNPKLNYYQGYNDIAATVLIAMGLQRGLRVLERISLEFLERFMERTMEKVNQELFYIFALLDRIHPKLLEHLENVELFPHFALAEYTTWYAHKYAENRKLLHRLFDYFLGSPPLMPLYLSTVIVAHRAAEIFNTTPDMGHTHKVLCTLPSDLPFETLLIEAKNLYRENPPESIEHDVRDYDNKRRRKEQEWKSKAEATRQERERQRQLRVTLPPSRLPYRVGSYKTIAVVTVLALGLYAFLKTSSSLN